ncbi:MAG: hypothetical protein KDA81_04465 [Planctomycetaceae bacterium]|nr:hypothetical protein [Planctomycetaceae bacterium]
MNSKRPGLFKTTARAASGGALVIGALLTLLFLRGGGIGSGTSEAPPTQVTTGQPERTPTVQAPSDARTPSDDSVDASGGLTDDEKKALSKDVLTVLIDEHEYLMEVPSDSETVYRPIELKRVIELAQQAPGDTNGIRVRVLRRESSRAAAEDQIKRDLTRAGIGEDSIYMPAEFIP